MFPRHSFHHSPGAQKGPPEAAGSKTVPEGGDPNALAGLAIVFTGELSAFSRDEAIEMAKRFGGYVLVSVQGSYCSLSQLMVSRVTTAPSGKTDYVVVGRDSGPKKLEIIKKLGIKTLNEDDFLNLIATRKGVLDKKQLQKLEKEEKKLKEDAAELGRRERGAKAKGVDPRSQLWTTRYAPRSMKEIVGNKANAEKIQQWLHDW
jgi:replication factor C subunit 1